MLRETPSFGPLAISLVGIELTPEEETLIQHPLVGGVVLFTRNYDHKVETLAGSQSVEDSATSSTKTVLGTRNQLQKLVNQIREAADAVGKKIYIAVDQEGFKVQRFRNEFIRLPAPQLFGNLYDQKPELGLYIARLFGFIMALQLKRLDVDISLAPVCDLDAGNPVITGYKRSFHGEPKIAIDLLKAYIDGMHAAGMQATLKHFPGHGQPIADSHKALPIDNRSFSDIEASDLQVFTALIQSGRGHAVMPAHILYPEIDPEHIAGASPVWLQKILRQQCGFQGAVISDCLSMKGAGEDSLLDRTRRSLECGDIATVCNQTPETYRDLLGSLDFTPSAVSHERIAHWVNGPSAKVRLNQLRELQALGKELRSSLLEHPELFVEMEAFTGSSIKDLSDWALSTSRIEVEQVLAQSNGQPAVTYSLAMNREAEKASSSNKPKDLPKVHL